MDFSNLKEKKSNIGANNIYHVHVKMQLIFSFFPYLRKIYCLLLNKYLKLNIFNNRKRKELFLFFDEKYIRAETTINKRNISYSFDC